MGYTTKFQGAFTFDKPVPAEVVLLLRDIAEMDYRDADFPTWAPRAHLQWEINRDRDTLHWDGNEKFYDYEEWLQALIDHVFAPAGLFLAGSVKYQGEEVEDCGTLAIVYGKVTKTPAVFP